MKTLLHHLVVPLLLCTGVAWGQVKIQENDIILNADSGVKNFETQIEYEKNNCYTVTIKNLNDKSISIKKNATMLPVLTMGTENETPLTSNDETILKKICFKRNTEYTFTITSDEEPKERIYKIKTKTDWSWTTTFGANAIFYTHRNKYISQKTDDGMQEVVEIQDRKQMELMPAVMFTFINNHTNIQYGFTGGLGINFEEIAIFTGISLGIGQNIILTGGIGIHKQTRPNSNYSIGQTIESTITNDNLNESQYRVNPFLGISFRLDKNPFKP